MKDSAPWRDVGGFELCRITLLKIAPRYSKCLHCRNCNAYICSFRTCRYFRMHLPYKTHMSISNISLLPLRQNYIPLYSLSKMVYFQLFITIQNTRMINYYTSRCVSVVASLHGRHVDTNDMNNKIKAQTQSSFEWEVLRTRFHGNLFTA